MNNKTRDLHNMTGLIVDNGHLSEGTPPLTSDEIFCVIRDFAVSNSDKVEINFYEVDMRKFTDIKRVCPDGRVYTMFNRDIPGRCAQVIVHRHWDYGMLESYLELIMDEICEMNELKEKPF